MNPWLTIMKPCCRKKRKMVMMAKIITVEWWTSSEWHGHECTGTMFARTDQTCIYIYIQSDKHDGMMLMTMIMMAHLNYPAKNDKTQRISNTHWDPAGEILTCWNHNCAGVWAAATSPANGKVVFPCWHNSRGGFNKPAPKETIIVHNC